MQRHGFARLMSSISSDPGVVVVIPNDDVQHSKGNQGRLSSPSCQHLLYSGFLPPLAQRVVGHGLRTVSLFLWRAHIGFWAMVRPCLSRDWIFVLTLDYPFAEMPWNLLVMIFL